MANGFTSVQDPFGISRLVAQINENRRFQAGQPMRDLQAQLLRGQVARQEAGLAKLAADQKIKDNLRQVIAGNTDKDPDFIALNYFRKFAPEKAVEFEQRIIDHTKALANIDKNAAAEFYNKKTGANLRFEPKTGKFGQPKPAISTETGKEVFIRTDPSGAVSQVEGFAPIPKQAETIEAIPGGGIRITKGGKEKKYTETQVKSGGFADRLQRANELSFDLEKDPNFSPTSLSDTILESTPIVGNVFLSGPKQSYNQAKLDFITANLRLESGAAIGRDELVKEDRKFFPQLGDTPEVIEQKRKARDAQLDILRAASGGFYKDILQEREQRRQKPQEPKQTVFKFDAQGNLIND